MPSSFDSGVQLLSQHNSFAKSIWPYPRWMLYCWDVTCLFATYGHRVTGPPSTNYNSSARIFNAQ